jgi:hypothetical protein
MKIEIIFSAGLLHTVLQSCAWQDSLKNKFLRSSPRGPSVGGKVAMYELLQGPTVLVDFEGSFDCG